EFERVAEEVLPTGDHIHIWKGQPLTNEQNQAYEYRVIETKIGSTEVVDNKALTYTVTYGGSVMEGFTVTNTSDNALEIPVTKVWVDNDNEGKTRPAQITFTALREDGDRKSQVFDITEENTYTITGLEKYKPNSTEEYTYTIEETAIGNYEALIEGTTVTNTLKATKDLSFTKTWVGGPEVKPEITVELRANGEEAVDNEGNPVETVTLTNGQEEGSFTNLPTYDNQGAFIDYTVVETSIDGRPVENGKAGNYTVLVDGTRIINVFEEEPVVEEQTVDITGQKLWIGGETEKPSIHLQLLQNGNKLGQPVELKEGSTEYTWKDLPMKDDQDTPYKYTVDEVRVPEGYERIPFEGTLVINKAVEEEPITEETTQVTGTKVWINAPDEKPIIELQLKQNGENFLEPVKLTNGNLQAVWSDLPLKDGNGKLYNYTVDEVSIPEGYRKEIIGGNVIVNTKIQVPPAEETISFTGTKIWLEAPNAKPEVQLILLQNGTQLGDPVTLKNGESSVTWNDLPAKDDEGNAYIYKVDEVHVPADYDKILYPNIPSTVFNKYKKPVDNPPAESITVTGKKVWVGGPAAKPDVQLVLLRDGVKQGDPVTLKNGTENYSWTNLLKSDPNGKAYVYSVDEVNVPSGYEKVQNGTTVINIYKTAVEPEIPARTIDVTGTKVWIGGPEKKPAIKLQLKQDGKNFGDPVTLDGKTEYKWTNLPKTNANGKDYVYSVDEVEVPSGYTKTAAGRIVVNTHKDYVEDNLIDITGTKIWKGGPEKKPAIKLQLKQNGKNFGKAVSLDGKTDYKWTDLPKANDSGKEYVYTVDEVEVPEDYTKKVSGMTVTNTHKDYVEENLIDITGSKIWKGGPSNRPVIELQLLQNGKKYGDPVKLDSKTDHTWTGLPKKDEEGKDYKYTIDEVNVPEDYVKSIDGLTVTNTHETFKEDNESGNGAGGTRTNTPARGTNSTGGYSTSRNINPNNNSNRYYSGQRTGEIPKTNDPTVFWGIMSVSMAVLLGAAYTGSKKMNKDEEEK
ncbi:MAG: Cna B-type domain-containing protein, partial [Gallicola sp.]|nr:Cna B-type domain-containing protein [Gallicola sp.]